MLKKSKTASTQHLMTERSISVNHVHVYHFTAYEMTVFVTRFVKHNYLPTRWFQWNYDNSMCLWTGEMFRVIATLKN